MSEPARNRFALDLEDLERQLRGAAQPQRPANAVDPLVELTRIVGQDDPLKDLFAQRGRGPAPVRVEPSFSEAQMPAQPANAHPVSAPPADMRGALDEFEALLRRGEAPRSGDVAQPEAPMVAPRSATQPEFQPAARQPEPPPFQHDVVAQAAPDFDHLVTEAYARPPGPGIEAPRDLDQDGAYAYAYDQQPGQALDDREMAPVAGDEMPELEPQRSRKGLWTAAALLAVGVVGVGVAMTMRSGTTGPDGQPPVIVADRGPTKVAPVNPGGAEIPNQNKQIYERAGETPAKQANVVSREEQPVDVQQAARSLPPRVVLAGPGTGSATEAGNPLAQAPAAADRGLTPSEPQLVAVPPVPGLGEPRKVRTVSIRPDGTPAPPPGAYANAPAPASVGAIPSPTRQPPTGPATTATSTASVPKPRPATPAEPAKTQDRAATPAPATTPVRTASVAPAPAPTVTPAPATAAIRSGSGDFAVQLAAPGSESEARATFAALQRKYPEQLGGQSPIVRKTELAGGKTVYRLRVGPYSRDDATTMCNQLSASGGQCFIAKN